MRTYFISSGIAGCYNVRCLLPLIANGWDGDQTSIHFGRKTAEDKLLATKQADIVVFHRPEDKKKLELMHILKKMGKKIIYDNDDTYKDKGSIRANEYINQERIDKGMTSLNTIADAFMIEADLVTTTTEFLAEEYRKLNPNVVVLPNCIDPFYYDEPLRNETDIIRIGVTGSIGVSSDIEIVAPIIKHYEHDPRVKIVFFSLPPNQKDNPLVAKIYKEEYAFMDSVDVEWHPTVNADEYYDKLNSLKLDFMIIPRQDNYFNRCKSNLKFIEASAFEIPCIAQGFADGKSPYQVNKEDQKYLKLVTDNKDWIPAMEELITNKQLRLDMGKKAREYVTENYDINSKAHLWEEAYESIM